MVSEVPFRNHSYEGYHPVAVALVGFLRSHLHGQMGKHYTSKANKALPAMVFGMVADVSSVEKIRLPLLRRLVRLATVNPSFLLVCRTRVPQVNRGVR